ncbi:MAG: flagellar M-ring protein FliF [Verrucomicrobia bacterium]|nr:flagellar M-ring protein FliF [Verrucomicrobiota bacterium]
MQALKVLGQQLSKIWIQLGLNQRVIIVLSGIAVFAGLAGLVYWSSRPSYTLLYGSLDLMEAGKITTELDQMKIPYQAKAGGTAIYVPQGQVPNVRAQLALKGMPKAEGVGFEIFDKPAFGMSDFVQQVNYMRALEGELARTIAKFNGIDQAWVKITKPESRLLVDPQKKATAAVFVKLRGNFQIEQTTVNAIRFLVAGSVEGLRANSVTVSDNSGNVLSETAEDGSLQALSSSQLSLKRGIEKYLADKVLRHLEGFLGPNQALVTVAAEINHESLQKTDEYYDPNKKVERTTNTRDEKTDSTSPQPGGVPGTTTNANVDTNAPAFLVMTNSVHKKDETTEYAISMSRTNLTRLAGGISRISASVTVNTNNNPVFAISPNSTNQLEQLDAIRNDLTQMVANALGPELGSDVRTAPNVKVTLLGFNREHDLRIEQKIDKEQRTELYWTIGRGVLYAVLGLAALIGFWRLVRSSSEELLPTGIPVGQLVGGQLVYEAPVGVPGMALPTGVAQAVAEQQRVEDILPEEQEVEELQAAKSKLVMDFGLGQQAPERITIEVLKQLIRENPAKMSQAARGWLSRKIQETDEA